MKQPRQTTLDRNNYKDGKPWRKSFSLNSFFVGLTIYYHPNGNLKYAGSFVNTTNFGEINRRVGLWKRFNEEGELIKTEIFVR